MPPGREFYDYEAKYLDGGSTPHIPAALDEPQAGRGAAPGDRGVPGGRRAPAWRASTSCCRATSDRLYVNEVNTIPGFTTISMFSKLWAATGVDYPALLDRLIQLALERHAEKQRLQDERAVTPARLRRLRPDAAVLLATLGARLLR